MFGSQSPGGFGAVGGFGQPQTQQTGGSVFGAFNTQAATPAFGASAPAFGQPQPAFGAASQPAFGQTPAFGQSSIFSQQNKPAFGAATTGFGAVSTGFGAASQGFGAASQSFGATPSLFGSSTFGQSPAAAPTAFGQSTPAFGGGGLFGSAAPAPAPGGMGSPFGQSTIGGTGGVFGAASPPMPQQIHPQLGYATDGNGSRVAPFNPPSQEGVAGQQGTKQVFKCISAMPQYINKSQEELRFEDYAAGVRGQVGAQPYGGPPSSTPGFSQPLSSGFGTATGGVFGSSPSPFGSPQQPPQTSSLFGSSPFGQKPASSVFGGGTSTFGTSTFGQSASAFGSPSTGGLFGSTQPAFGQASQPAFGVSSTPMFGQSSPSTFGQQPAAFGQPQSQPAAFGGGLFGTSQPAATPSIFGQPAFGTSQPAPAFGQSPGGFGAASTGGLFGAPSSGTSLFGASQPAGGLFGAGTSQPFGASQGFGAASQSSLFGGGFGAKPASSGGLFGASPSSSGLFGGASTFGASPGGGLFGASSPSTGLFGASSSSLFSGGGSPALGGGLFGAQSAPQANTGGLFGAQTGGGLFGAAAPAPAAQPQQFVPLPAPGQNPYGVLPAVPKVPEMKSGIAAIPPANGVRSNIIVGHRMPRMYPPRPGKPVKRSPHDTGQPSTSNWLYPPKRLFQPHTHDSRLLVISAPFPSTVSSSSSPSLSPPAPPSMATPAATPPLRTIDLNTDAHLTTPASVGGGVPSLPHTPADVAALVPKVPDDYYIVPSLNHLKALAAAESGLLQDISDFKVGKQALGEIHFLQPVSVEGLDLGSIVQINPGEVIVYPDDDSKPEVGSGLNKPARITLKGVGDKMFKSVANAEERNEKIRRKLQKHCASIGARYIDFTPDGSWVFEVEHFSRWGLPDDENEEDASPRDASPGSASGGTAERRRKKPASVVADSEESEDEQQQRYQSFSEEMATGFEGQAGHPDMDLDVAMSDEDEDEVSPWPLELEQQVPTPPGLSSLAADIAMLTPRDPQPPPPPIPWLTSERPDAAPGLPTWQAAPRPLTLQEPDALPSAARAAVASQRLVQADATRASADSWPHAALDRGAGGDRCSTAALVDAGLAEGRRFRVGWSPTGRLAVPVAGQNDTARAVAVLQLVPGGGLLVPDEPSSLSTAAPEVRVLRQFQRARAVKLLEVHATYSANSPPPHDAAPEWSFGCTSSTLPTKDMLEASIAAFAELPADERNLLISRVYGIRDIQEHFTHTWDLLHVLFRHIKPAAPDAGPGSEEADALLESCIRKHDVSEWLERQVEDEVADALSQSSGGEDCVQEAILQLLTAHDLPGAAHLARLAGYPRLATLLTGAGLRTRTTEALREQLGRDGPADQVTSWRSAGYLDARPPLIPRTLLCIYDLLAGNVQPVQKFLAEESRQGSQLTWLRSLALCVWYGCKPEEPLVAAFSRYEQSLEALAATELARDDADSAGIDAQAERNAVGDDIDVACPYPPHLISSSDLPATFQMSSWRRHTDVQYELFKLASGEAASNAAMIPEKRIGRARGCTPDPLDSLLPWLLLCVLRATGQIAGGSKALLLTDGSISANCPSEADAAFAAVTMDAANLLQLLGEPYWALYAVLHLPVSSELMQAAKDIAVRRILAASWPQFSADDVERLHKHLKLPRSWLAEAEAWWASTTGNTAAEVKALVGARLPRAAEIRLCESYAPAALRDGAIHGLVELVGLWQGCSTSPSVALLEGYLQLLQALQERAAADGVLAARTAHDRRRGEMLLQQLCEAIAQLQERPPHSKHRLLAAPTLPQLAMLRRMAQNVATWMLGGPCDAALALPPSVMDTQLSLLPAEQRVYHRLAAAADL